MKAALATSGRPSAVPAVANTDVVVHRRVQWRDAAGILHGRWEDRIDGGWEPCRCQPKATPAPVPQRVCRRGHIDRYKGSDCSACRAEDYRRFRERHKA